MQNEQAFDWKYYLLHSRDLGQNGIHSYDAAWQHFERHGKSENRLFRWIDKLAFDWKSYVAEYSDLGHITCFAEGWNHFQVHGLKEEKNFHTLRQKYTIMSIGFACKMRVHLERFYGVGHTNFFDWLITDFQSVLHVLEKISLNHTSFITRKM